MVMRSLIKANELALMIQQRVPMYILDAGCLIPGVPGNSKEEHFKTRIPGAKFFDVDDIVDKSSDLPHMLPSNEDFKEFMKKLKVKKDNNLVVCYDRLGCISSPRAWYTFKVFGRENVAVLDGGLPKWLELNLPTESGEYEIYQYPSAEEDSEYNYSKDESKVKNLGYVKLISALLSGQTPQSLTQIVDARPPARFAGAADEPRPGVRPGNVPGSINVPFKNLFNKDQTFKTPEELTKVYEDSGVNLDQDRPVVHLCGSGVTACINILGMELIGKSGNLLYDGSWTEYGSVIEEETRPNPKAILERAYEEDLKRKQ